MSDAITATKVKDLDGFTGQAALYKLSQPVEYGYMDDDKGETDHIVVSATVALLSGPETYIFPADESGKIVDWVEMDGSMRGTLNHSAALKNAGYKVAAGAAE